MTKASASRVLASLCAGVVPIAAEVGGLAPIWGAHEPAGWAIALAWVLSLAATGVGVFHIVQAHRRGRTLRHAVLELLALIVTVPVVLYALVSLVAALALILTVPYSLLLVGTFVRLQSSDA